MNRQQKLWMAGAFVLTLGFYAIGWALTSDQIWQKVFDPINNALRVNQVAP